jgi:hypothetical protein
MNHDEKTPSARPNVNPYWWDRFLRYKAEGRSLVERFSSQRVREKVDDHHDVLTTREDLLSINFCVVNVCPVNVYVAICVSRCSCEQHEGHDLPEPVSRSGHQELHLHLVDSSDRTENSSVYCQVDEHRSDIKELQ